MSSKLQILHRQYILLLSVIFVTGILAFSVSQVAAQGSVLTVTPLTWNVIGLDSNAPTTGPKNFPVGAQVCNTGGAALTNVVVDFTWTSANANVNIRAGSLTSITIPSLAAGACYDAYFEVEINTVVAAYDTTRSYVITATSGAITGSTPQPRTLYVEHLISQNRNATTDVQFGTNLASLTSVAAGGTMTLMVGQTYYIRLVGSTATQGYEQLESFLTLSNTVFQILGVSSTYSADTSATVASPNLSLYANGCVWENDPNSPNYRSCLSTGKAGGSVLTTYQVKIIGGGGSTQTLNSLLYDFSGSSYHYNSDLGVGTRFAAIIDPSSATIAKQFSPASISAGGISTLVITLGNPTATVLTGYNFIDNLPTGVTVATTPSASTSGCGTPTFAPIGGAASLTFSNGTVAANSTCTISIKVTASTAGTYNNVTNHLFIDTFDTGKTGTATLTVTTAPTAPACTPNQPLATWNFLTGSSATNPLPTSTGAGVTASAAAGAGLVPVISTQNVAGASGSWASDSVAVGTTLSTANNEYFEFTIDTTGVQSVTLQFQAQRTAQGPQSIQLYYGTTAPGTASSVYSITSQNNWFTFGPTTLNTGLNASGNTIFRLYVYNSGTDNSGHSVFIDGVTFTGCVPPRPPTLTKAFSPTSIGSGGTSTLTFTLTNLNSTTALTGVAFSDTLPTGMTISAAASSTCGGTLTATVGSGTVSLTGGGIAISGTCTIAVPVTSSTAGPSTNISEFISSTETGANNTATGSASATLTVLSPPQISKLFSPSPILAGTASTLTFTITNPNQNNVINGLAFSDTFPVAPGAMLVANPASPTNTCGGTFTTTIGTGSVNLTGGTIAAGGSCTLSVKVTAPVTGTYANTTGNVSHIVNSTTFNGNTASSSLSVSEPHPSISLLKQVGTSPTGPWSSYQSVVAGANVYYLISVENTGDVPLSPVTVNDPLVNTAACTWTDPLPVASALNNNHITTCVVGPVTAIAGTNPNTATANGTYGGTVYADTSMATYATAAITVDKVANKTNFTTLGELINYTFTVTNSGFATVSGPVTINDNLATDETCPALTTVGDLDNFFDPGETIVCTASYTVTSADMLSGTVTNIATASAGGITSPSDTVTVTRIMADLSLTKVASTTTPVVGGTITFTLTVTNNGTDNTTNVAVLDTLPTGFTYQSDSPTQGTYDNATGIWTVGTLNNGANATLVITVLVNPTGNYTNTAQVSASDLPDPDSTPNNNNAAEDDQASSSPTPGASADLSLTKSVDNATPNVGSTVIFTVTVNNAGPNDTATVSVTDQLPAGYTFLSYTASQGTYANGTGIWTVGALNNGINATLAITATVNATGPYANTAQVTSSSLPDPDSTPANNNGTEDDQATNTPIPVPIANLSLTKTVDNATPDVGGTITFTVTVANAGPSTATNVIAVDQLPAGYTFISSTPSQGNYDAPSGVWTIGTINNGANATLQIMVTVNVTGPYANTAQVTNSNQTDPNSTPNNNNPAEDDQATNTPTPRDVADLSLTKVVDSTTPDVGTNITFTITVTNSGPSTATNVTVLDLLPAGLSYQSDNPSQGAYVAGTGVWTVGTLLNGASATLQITVTVNATGSYANSAQVTGSDQHDPDSTPNNGIGNGEDDQATSTPTPRTIANLSLTKIVDNATPNVGSNVTFTIVVSNAGPNAATNVAVDDQLPAGYLFVSATPTQGNYVSGTGVWTIGTINSGANVTLQIVATVTTVAAYDNVAQVSAADQFDPNSTPGNNVTGEDDQAAASVTPAAVIDLSLAKSVDIPNPTVGTNVTYTLTVSNAGPSDASGVVIADLLPAGLTYISSAPSQGNYDNATGLWTVGAIANGSNATLQITVTVLVPGVITNSAQVTAADQNDSDSTVNNGIGNGEDDQASVSIPQGVANLSLTKDVDNATPNVGSNVTFTITVANAGLDTATHVSVVDQLPTGYTLVSSTPSQGTYDTLSGNWTVGTINSGANATLQIVATVNATGIYSNTAQVTASDQFDPNSTPNNNNPAEDDQATNTPTPVSVADLSLAKTIDDPNPNVGGTVVYTLTVSNAGPSDATGVQVTDQLPAGLVFVSYVAGQGTYDNTTGVWDIGGLNNGSNTTLQITATINVATSVTNGAQVTAAVQTDPDSPHNNGIGNGEDDQATVSTQQGTANLSLAKTVDNATPDVGANVIFTITVSNAGPNNATQVSVTDQIPSGYTYVSNLPSQGTYNDTTGVWTIGTINNGANATLQITVTVNATGTYANTAQVTASDQFDPNSTPNNNDPAEDDQATNTPTPVEIADLAISKVVDNPNPTVGGNFNYILTISNTGPSTATNVTVLDQLPAGVTFVSSTPSQGNYDNATGVWTVGTIAANANATLQITVTLNVVGIITNSTQVTAADQRDPDSPHNNGIGNGEDDQSSVSTPQGIADLNVSKIVNNSTPNVGDTVTFTVTANNAGPDDATNVTVQDQLPTGYTFSTSTPSQGTYDPVTGVWTVGTVANGTNATILIAATVNASGIYNNIAQIETTDQFDPDSTPNNNIVGEDDQSAISVSPLGKSTPTPVPPLQPTSAPTPGIVIIDPVITKSVDPKFAQPGEVVTWTITVSNPGTLAATNIVIVDNMPSELQILSVIVSTGNAAVGGQVVTFTLATLQPGQSVSFSIKTRVRSNVKPPFFIVNQASLSNAENLTLRYAQNTLVSLTSLPSTGETPWWRLPLLVAFTSAIGGMILIFSAHLRRRLKHQ